MKSKDFGCLVLHGYGGRPFEMGYVAEALRLRGMAVQVPVLAGHEGDVDRFAASRFSDWLHGVEAAYTDLQQRHERVALVGFSLGGTLSLALAERYPVAALVTVAAPVFLTRLYPYWAPDLRLFLTGMLQHVLDRVPTSPRSPESKRVAPWEGYEGAHYIAALHSFKVATAKVRRDLGRIHAPIMILHGTHDRAVHPDNAWTIASGVNSSRREVHLLTVREKRTSGHMVVTHEETRDQVCSLVGGFLDSL